ncbi:CatB-related O-acetyltransferase [Marivita sp. S2033]|uniref:CatB-related O-acetyltransferase n=1 Tax=Marivita sp. S2033 TaxID=3373187 RepID=UPI003981CC7D
MSRPFADPTVLHPITLPDGTPHTGTVFLKPAIDHPRIAVGDYSYASSHHPPADWAVHLAPYLYPFSPERLTIGKFCQIADGVRFITASANHRYDGFSSFPFAVFGGVGFEDRPSMPAPGRDTVIGHDVWLCSGATVLPGAQIGNGVIVGAGAVVQGNIPSYSIVTGNPARLHRMRFAPEIVQRLEAVAWWDWPIALILQAEAEICGGDIEALERLIDLNIAAEADQKTE